MAVGLQDSFSWSGVALSALGSVVTSGIAGSGLFSAGALGAAQAAATANVLTQGIGVVTGLQSKFNWRSVAASAARLGGTCPYDLSDRSAGALAVQYGIYRRLAACWQ